MVATRWLVALSLLIGVRGQVAAQTQNTGSLRGTVVSADGGGLQAALIRVLDRHLTETTHADGSYFLPVVPVGPQRVAITAIGFQAFFTTVTITPGDTVRLDVTLTPAVLRLEEIVTTGTISARARSEVVSPTSVVAGAALDRQLDATVAASLRHEPGVAAGGLGPATSQPVIRGLSGDRVVMLQDGIRPGDLAS
ncbi:MAG: carboxypeptidase-like regulatory domain-containing protein, partial [Gemmatimonadales bacterium]